MSSSPHAMRPPGATLFVATTSSLLVLACARPPAPMAELESSNIAYATCGRFGAPAGSPDSLARSATAFDRAHEHYDAGEYRKAAEAFGRAADVLREGPGADEDVVTRNRRVAYANMVLALLSIDAVDEARRRLSAAARVDQPLAPDLTTVEGALPSPPRCDLRAPDRPG